MPTHLRLPCRERAGWWAESSDRASAWYGPDRPTFLGSFTAPPPYLKGEYPGASPPPPSLACYPASGAERLCTSCASGW
jgi:hypothetical protein